MYFLIDGIKLNIFMLVTNIVKLIQRIGQRSKLKKEVLAKEFGFDLSLIGPHYLEYFI